MARHRGASAVLAGALLVLAGCGSDAASGSAAPATSGASAAHGGDHGGYELDDPSAVPAAQVAGAELVTGAFTLLDTAPEGYDAVAGTAELARSGDGTTVTATLTGLRPGADVVLHVHAGACAADGGGEHYRFDPAGADVPPNEIHLGFTPDASGAGTATVRNAARAGAEARSVVAHPADLPDNRIACADLS